MFKNYEKHKCIRLDYIHTQKNGKQKQNKNDMYYDDANEIWDLRNIL